MKAINRELRGGGITIGTFDGLHLGHQAILRRTMEESQRRGIPFGVVTFEPPPYYFFHKEFPFLLTPLREKLALLKAMGIDLVSVFNFTEELANFSPIEFLNKIREEISPRVLVVGSDFRFGKDQKGDVALLERIKGDYGFELIVLPLAKKSGVPVKSTTIREKLLLGNIRLANLLLGRRYAIFGQVVKGAGRGRKIGFPTLNLKLVDRDKLLPIDGVYAVYFYPNPLKQNFYKGVANIGRRPTFEDKEFAPLPQSERHIEVHLIGIKELDAPIKEAKVEIVERIRPEKKFLSLDEMRNQIKEDVAKAERIL